MFKKKRISPTLIIALGFVFVILTGAILLYLPITHNEGVDISFIDSLFTATSAVCVTGLVTIDTADSFNFFGQLIVAILIQTGGLGFASIGVGFILLARKTVGFKERLVLKEALNVGSVKGIIKLVKSLFTTTLIFESIGAILSFITFSKDFLTPKAIWISIFHAISSFNNAGFDILGGFRSLTEYSDEIFLNLTTTGLIIFGGLGFFVINDIMNKRSFKKLSLHSKIVIVMTITLLLTGTVLIKLTEENITWLQAYFMSTSARTAGFSTLNINQLASATLFILIILMFIGASPGSTGGGIKTTTAFTLFKGAIALSCDKHCTAFKRRISTDIICKSFVIFLLALTIVVTNTLILNILEPQFTFIQLLFEVISAFGTVGLSTGITPHLGPLSRLIIIVTMYVGRVGPLTILSIWAFKQKTNNITYSEESIAVG